MRGLGRDPGATLAPLPKQYASPDEPLLVSGLDFKPRRRIIGRSLRYGCDLWPTLVGWAGAL